MSTRKPRKITGKKEDKMKKADKEQNVSCPSPTVSENVQMDARQQVSSTMKKDSSLIGYVHRMSPLKRNKRDTIDYSTLRLQTEEDDLQDVLCYSKAKRVLLMTSMNSRTPVRIDRFAKSQDGLKVIINDMTSVSIPNQTEYSFQYVEQHETITNVEMILKERNPNDWVTIRGKVVKLWAVTKVGRSMQMSLRKGAFADSTGTIQLQIWEDNIAEIQEGNFYMLSQVRVGIWDGQKYVGTTKQSIITLCNEDQASLTNIDTREVDEALHSANECVIEVEHFDCVESVDTYKECHNKRCSKRIIKASSNLIIHCDQCGHSMRASDCKTNICAKVVAVHPDEGKDICLTCFSNVLGDVLEDRSTLDNQGIAEELLLLGRMSLSYNSTTNVVSKIVLLK